MNILDVVEEAAKLPSDWHGAGTVTTNVLRAIVRYAERAGPIQHSVETGSGRTSLLFSHLSPHHTVFAVDAGRSISQVKSSHLFNPKSTTFVEGPTQRTLPKHTFTHKHQIVFIDGPHGYPFPDLEYYYLYPTIDAGGLLFLDDIQIPSIGRMFDVIKADTMFELLDVVDRNTAILRRTDAPLVDPESDSWWLQGYNLAYYQQLLSPPPTPPEGNKFAAILQNLSKRFPNLLPH